MKLYGNVAALAALASACGLSTGPSDQPIPGQSSEMELRVGEEQVFPGTVLRIGFVGVAEDSRCPLDVVCVWEGNAAAEIGVTAGSGPTRLRVLNTSLEPRFTDFGGLRVTLIGVTPEPREAQSIPPESYVLRLRVEQVPS